MAGKIANWLMDFCQMTVGDRETTSRMHLAAHELVENVLKYGSSPTIGLEFAVESRNEESIVRLSTKNAADPAQLEEVSRRVSALKLASDPIAYYDQLVRSTAPLDGPSGLGLARIRAEAGLSIDCAIEGGEVSISVESVTRRGAR